MECKCIQGIWVNTDVCRELIETLWNVNYITEEQAQKINEGIETLWNVNDYINRCISYVIWGINRNIVECKLENKKYTIVSINTN